MRRLTRASRWVIAALCLSLSTTAVAATADSGGSGNSGSGIVDVWASSGYLVRYTSTRCAWWWLSVNDVIGLGGTQTGPGALTGAELASKVVKLINGVEYRLYAVTCGNVTSLRYARAGTSAADLRGTVFDHASQLIPLPTPNMSPSESVGGVVNLGMWLAVAAVAIPPITAEAGPAWITVRPRQIATWFDFGDSSTLACAGVGTPIVNLNTTAQGGCGHTYRRSSPPSHPYTITITSVWELPYTSSNGAGSLQVIARRVTVSYKVVEVQTVGTRG